MLIPLFHVDAFTNIRFTGNPAAVCPLKGWLDDEMLRKVAAENNLSETAFFVPTGDHYELRWFSSRGEVKLCGHATLASAFVVFHLLKTGLQKVRFETRYSGSLTVERHGNLLAMDFPAFFPETCRHVPVTLFPALRAEERPSEVLEVNETYIAVYENERVIRGMRPDLGLLEQLHPYVVAVTAPGEDADFVSRYFKPSYGMPEDPVTGSAHCALAPYWATRLHKPQLHARQRSQRGGELWCEIRDNRVTLKGHAVLSMQGALEI
jgi:predicted PhzF superfamily epimerase YddE/YHI9